MRDFSLSKELHLLLRQPTDSEATPITNPDIVSYSSTVLLSLLNAQVKFIYVRISIPETHVVSYCLFGSPNSYVGERTHSVFQPRLRDMDLEIKDKDAELKHKDVVQIMNLRRGSFNAALWPVIQGLFYQ